MEIMAVRKTIGSGHDLANIGQHFVVAVVCISIQVSKASAHWQNRNQIFKWTVIYAFNQFRVHFRGMQMSFVCVLYFSTKNRLISWCWNAAEWKTMRSNVHCTVHRLSWMAAFAKIASLVKVQNHFCIAIFTLMETILKMFIGQKNRATKHVIESLNGSLDVRTVWFI